MASRKLFCPECGAKIPSSARTGDEIICPNDNCLYIFTPDEITVSGKNEKKAVSPRKNPLKTYAENLKTLRNERLGKLKSSFLRKSGALVLAVLVFLYAAVFEYALSRQCAWPSPFRDYVPVQILTFLNPYADALATVLPADILNVFPVYYTVFTFSVYALFIVSISLLFTRYIFYAAVKMMRFVLAEVIVLYTYFIVWPLVPTLGPKFICEDFIIFAFSHVWPFIAAIILLSLIKPVAGYFCARSNRYALLYKGGSAV